MSQTREQRTSEKDQAAELVLERLEAFENGLSDKRKYPLKKFLAFAQAVRKYAEVTRDDALVHKAVVREVNGLRDALAAERKRIPDGVLMEAERLECLVFSGYDPCFEGDEPPGL